MTAIKRSQIAKFMMRQFVDVLMERCLIMTWITRELPTTDTVGENHFCWVAVFYVGSVLRTCL